METLYFGHNIFLNKEQKFELLEGKQIKVKGKYTFMKESEKFKKTNILYENSCIYKLVPKKIVFKTIKKSIEGFKIYLKNDLNVNFLDKLKNLLFSETENKGFVKNILDIKDGGVERILIQEQYYYNNLNIKHKILIQKKEILI
jgi:hypothetical protein